MIDFNPTLTKLSQNTNFVKAYNAQHSLIDLIEKSVDNGGAFDALLTDLFKACDCLSHKLFVAKLDTYGLDKRYLILIYKCFPNRKQMVKINDSYSSWSEILFEVPGGSILVPVVI